MRLLPRASATLFRMGAATILRCLVAATIAERGAASASVSGSNDQYGVQYTGDLVVRLSRGLALQEDAGYWRILCNILLALCMLLTCIAAVTWWCTRRRYTKRLALLTEEIKRSATAIVTRNCLDKPHVYHSSDKCPAIVKCHTYKLRECRYCEELRL